MDIQACCRCLIWTVSGESQREILPFGRIIWRLLADLTNFGCQRLESPVSPQTGLYMSFPPKRQLKNPWTISTHEKIQVSPVFFTVKGGLSVNCYFLSVMVDSLATSLALKGIVQVHTSEASRQWWDFPSWECALCASKVSWIWENQPLHEKITILNIDR